MRRRETGFTLIEVLIAIVIVGILSAVAIPSYTSYVLRGRLTEAYTTLAAMQPKAEEFWSNNRTYANLPLPANTANFSYTAALTADSYTITASGNSSGKAADFKFTIDQNGNRATTGAPAGWTTSASCWIDRKGGQCVQ
jgi:type IV pilus assembly protein PilE